MSLLPWKMVSAACVCVLMTSLTTAIESYDELSPGDLSLLYPEHNFIDAGPQSVADLKDEGVLKSFLLFKLLTSMRNQVGAMNGLTGPKWISADISLVPQETLDLSTMKGNNMKRFSDSILPKARVDVKSPAPKWKTKKGKVGSQMICYFKLCAFRPPM